jgi:hypothetical protein
MLLIMDRVERNSVAAHPHQMSLQEATGVYVLNRYKLANNNVLWRPKNFGRHFLDIQVKCK